MNDRRSTDRLLSAWFESRHPSRRPDVLRTDIHRATARIRPRPAWLARLGGHHMDVITGGARRRDTRLVPLLALLGLLLAAAVAAVYVGSRPATTAVVPTESPAVTPAATRTPTVTPTPAFVSYADLAVTMPYPIRQVQMSGLGGNFLGIGDETTNELMRAVYRVDPSTNTKTLVVTDLPVGPSDHANFGAAGGSIIVAHDEGGGVLRYDDETGELLGESPTGERPLDAYVMGSRVWFPNFGDGSVTGIDGQTGEALTIPIPQFNGSGPLSLAARRQPALGRFAELQCPHRDRSGDRDDRGRGSAAGREELRCRDQRGPRLGDTLRGLARAVRAARLVHSRERARTGQR